MRELAYWNRNRVSRRTALRGAALGIAGLGGAALIGCGGEEEGPAETRGTPAAPAAPATPVAATAGQPKQGGVFRYQQHTDPPQFDISATLTFALHSPVGPLYNRLVRTVYAPEAEHPGDFSIMPDLAEEWEIADDLQTYIFHLRKDARWHNIAPVNGRPVVAQDIKVAFDHFRSKGAHTAAFSPVEDISTPDDHTVIVRMHEPFALFMENIANAVRKIFAPEVLEREGGLDATPVIGTGPFMFDSFRRGDSLVAKRNPDYFDPGIPYLDSYEFRIVGDDSTRIANYRARTVDYIGLASWDSTERLLAEGDSVHSETLTGHSVFNLAMNMEKPPFNDVRMRRALSLATDRQATIDSLYGGRGISGWGVPWAFAQDEPWRPEQLPWARFDPAEGKKLMAAAGVEPGTEIPFFFHSYNETMASQQALFQAEVLASLGINLLMQPQEYSTYFNGLVERNWDGVAWAFQIGTSSTTDDFMYQNMHSTAPGQHFRINDPEIDDLVERIRRNPELEERREMVGQVHAIDQDLVYRLPMPYPHSHAVVRPYVQGWQPPLVLRAVVGYGSAGLERVWMSN